jgi:hypothetical protein
LFEFEPTIVPTVQPKPTIVPAPVVAPVVAPVFAPEPEPEPILEPVAETVVEAPTPAEPILEPAIEPIVEPAMEPDAKPAFGGFYSRRPEVEHIAEPIAAPTPAVIEPPIEMTALPVEVVEPLELIVAPELFSAVSAMIAPFIETRLHEPRLHRAVEVVEKTAAPETAVAEPSMMVLAAGGEPVRYIDEEMEAALDILARAAREEILAVNAPATATERATNDEDSPWLAPIRKAWEPPLEEEQGRGSRWSFFRRTG